jgi:hypothetical protein
MKKYISYLLILTHFFCYSQTQKEVIFKVQYKPDMKYNQMIEQKSQTNIKYSGSEDFLNKLKDKGLQNPMITSTQSKIETILKTGEETTKKTFPLTIEFTKTESSDGKIIIPDGTIIYGNGSNGNMPTLDSIVSKELDENFKISLLQTIQSTLNQLSFPEKKVKIGDSFIRESPLSIPISGSTVEMTITTYYKLLDIENSIANFDVSSVYTMKSVITKYDIKATGNSKGKMLYDIVNNNLTNYKTDTEMKMNFKLEDLYMDLESKSSFIQTIEISKK